MFINEAGVEIRVNGHLLAGQGVQGKTGGDFRGAHGAVVDDQVLDSDEGEENHEANDVVSTNDELAEGLDDVAGGGSAFIAVEKNTAAAGDIERDAEERQKKQQRRENRELNRPKNVQGGKENDHAQSDARSEKNIEHDSRNRHQHDKDSGDRCHGDEPISGAFGAIENVVRAHEYQRAPAGTGPDCDFMRICARYKKARISATAA